MNSNAFYLLIRHQEIALKGRNRPEFEKRLRISIQKTLGKNFGIKQASGRLLIHCLDGASGSTQTLYGAIPKLTRLGGITAVAPCRISSLDPHEIIQNSAEWIQSDLLNLSGIKSFAIRTKRIDKNFPFSSAEMDKRIGSKVGEANQNLRVDLKNPDLKVTVEMRQQHALIYSKEFHGSKGLPLDSTQRVVCLLSGGIDSPVAAYELLRRGCTPILVHFHSKPYTSEASISKVKRLAEVLAQFAPFPLELWLVPLLEIQKSVRDHCNPRYLTIHYRRFMMRIAQEIAKGRNAKAIVTGDALGQVASQTLSNLFAVEDAAEMPVFRPLISRDKEEIIRRAQDIGTFAISIEPHDDACVLFAPNNPTTQAKILSIREEDERLPVYELVFSALDAAERNLIKGSAEPTVQVPDHSNQPARGCAVL